MAAPLPPVFHVSPDVILDDARTAIAKAHTSLDAIIKEVQLVDATFANTILPFVQAENELLYARRLLEFYQYVSAAGDIRKASIEAAKLFAEYDVKINSNKNFFALVSAVQGRKELLSTESQRLVDKLLLEFHRRGLDLESADRQHLQQIEIKLEELKTTYGENLKRGQESGVWFTRSELDGISDKILDKLKTGENENEGKVFLSFSHAHSYVGLRYPKDSEIRRKYYIANANKCRDNLEIHRRTLFLREKQAQLLGYKNHAEYSLVEKMAKTPQAVNNFLEDLFTKLTPKRLAYHQRWRHMKSEDQKALNRPDGGKFYDWDRIYYTRLMLEEDFINEQKVAEYFPLNQIIQTMLKIYEQIFAIDFEPVSHSAWHDDVTIYAVWNQSRAESDFLGWLYMDLYPRPGKWPGFADMAVHPVRTLCRCITMLKYSGVY